MADRPILFSGPMVQALPSGRKTQTRRVVKGAWGHDFALFRSESLNGPGAPLWPYRNGAPVVCPYGAPGDRLVVRETWALVALHFDPEYGVVESVEDWPKGKPIPKAKPEGWTVLYRADGDFWDQGEPRGFVWRPSIHMPRWASRITLEITDVRVERVQEITEGDALAEGIRWTDEGPLHAHYTDPHFGGRGVGAHLNFPSAREAFASLWDSINGARGFGWDANPWVWVVGFKRVDAEEGK